MPRAVTYYECEICRRRFDSYDVAENCENRGPGIEYPIGCIFGEHTPGTLYSNITFAVAKNVIVEHVNRLSMWACRGTNGTSDSLGEHTCGGNIYKPYTKNLDPNHPTFKRLVAYLQSENIPVTVWLGGSAITLADYMNIWEKLHNLD
jgi:hypothetical protein